MRTKSRILSRAAVLVAVVAAGTAVTMPAVSSAAPTPLFTQCPAVGPDSGCGMLITVNTDGTTTVATDPGQPALSSTAVLVGIQYNSNATLPYLSLTGTAGSGAFALSGQGLCSFHPGPCFGPHAFGPTGYEGPGTSFSGISTDHTQGTVTLNGGLSPDSSAYLSLGSAPVTVTDAPLQAAVDVTSSPVSAFVNVPFSGPVGQFTVGYSTAPAADFTATVDWGDGTGVQTLPAGSITQPGGSTNPYVVDASHTYAGTGPFTTTLTVTDTSITTFTNSGTASGNANVVVQPVTLSPVAIPTQVDGTPFSGAVATFTDADTTTTGSSYAATVDWGDGSGAQAATVTPTSTYGTPFTVSGTHTYSISGSLTLTVAVTINGVTSIITEPIQVDAVQVTVPCTGSCSGGVTTPLQTASGKTTSTTGSLFVSLSDGSLDCGTGYDFAPQITTVTTNDVPSTSTVKVKVTFLRENLQGPYGAPLAVCFEANNPFTELNGSTTPPVLVNGQTQYIGLLPACQPTRPQKFGPCLGHVSEPLPGWKTVQENIKFPAGDPKFR